MSIAEVGHISYEGQIVQIAENGRFVVEFNGDQDDRHWSNTFEEAKAAIEARNRRDRGTRRINVDVLDDEGVGLTLTGYHAGHGKALVKGWDGRGELYGDTPTARSLLAQHVALKREIGEVERDLKKYRVPTSAKAYGTPTADEIEAACRKAEAKGTTTIAVGAST